MTKEPPAVDSLVIGSVQLIPVDRIDVGKRLRAVDQDWVQTIAESIRQIGLRQPIEVRAAEGSDRFILVSGAHRLRGSISIGQTEIRACLVQDDDLTARLSEIHENLYRHDLNPLDRASFLSEAKSIWEALHPGTKKGVAGGKARQNSATEIISFAEKSALASGYTPRTIRLAISMYERLTPAVRERLAGSPVARDQNQLIALSKLSPAEQAKVVRMLLAPDLDRPKKVRDALAMLQGKRAEPRNPTDKGFQQLVDVYTRANKRARTAFVAWLRESGEI